MLVKKITSKFKFDRIDPMISKFFCFELIEKSNKKEELRFHHNVLSATKSTQPIQFSVLVSVFYFKKLFVNIFLSYQFVLRSDFITLKMLFKI